MRTDPNTAGLNLDARSLDGLRRQAAADPKAATRQAAVQFESLFMQMVVKSMRDATPSTDKGAGGDQFTSMLDSHFAKQFAGRPGGLADMLEKQLSRQMGNLPPVSAENQAAAAATPATGATGNADTGSRAAGFIRDMLPHAKEAERRTGVPASFILGQAALESGWGKGAIRNADGSNSFNLFGIKAQGGWQGAQTEVATTEYEDGQPVKQKAAFRSYSSYADAFTDYARMLAGSPRYAQVARSSTVEQFAGGMQRAGYATDPQYGAKLARTIHHTIALQRALVA
ncbi:flagellar assembly peptidoglycan hydrolase FlgJ [Ramlibacter humi]|uniref:Peptidoglycan hydrolase FlgJ n=1 Tax=Ramlibacter humi TaxID=2530451 RepID=A0A4Z0CAL1_9BURK|nr:flagellar assembly peptidoglycan hydrolase FlgJ [Ramlibacter humi]TFZ08381.1 flagellar assembly peptidoglycan hydrolase FlgJ [Ramlibacter humi]